MYSSTNTQNIAYEILTEHPQNQSQIILLISLFSKHLFILSHFYKNSQGMNLLRDFSSQTYLNVEINTPHSEGLRLILPFNDGLELLSRVSAQLWSGFSPKGKIFYDLHLILAVMFDFLN